MNWTKASKWHLESEDKRYMVTKYMVKSVAVYVAIRRPETVLLVADSADKCKQACEEDAK